MSSVGSSLAVAFVGTAYCLPAAGAGGGRIPPAFVVAGLQTGAISLFVTPTGVTQAFSCALLSGAPGRAVQGSWQYLHNQQSRLLTPGNVGFSVAVASAGTAFGGRPPTQMLATFNF